MNAESPRDTLQVICELTDLIPHSGVAALVQDQQIALFYLPDDPFQQVYALSNYDPIGRANVMSRGIVGDINGEPVVASPLYKQRYSLLTGQCLDDATQYIPIFSAQVCNGQINLMIPTST